MESFGLADVVAATRGQSKSAADAAAPGPADAHVHDRLSFIGVGIDRHHPLRPVEIRTPPPAKNLLEDTNEWLCPPWRNSSVTAIRQRPRGA